MLLVVAARWQLETLIIISKEARAWYLFFHLRFNVFCENIQKYTLKNGFYCSKARRRREKKSKIQNRHNQKLPLKRVMGGIIFFSKDDTFGTCTND